MSLGAFWNILKLWKKFWNSKQQNSTPEKKDDNVMLYYVVHMYIIIYFCFKTEASLILNAFQQAEWCDRYVLFESNHELLCPLPFQASLGDFQGRESSQRAENRALWQDLKQAICGRSSGATRRTHQIRINEMIDGDGGFMKESLNLVRRLKIFKWKKL